MDKEPLIPTETLFLQTDKVNALYKVDQMMWSKSDVPIILTRIHSIFAEQILNYPHVADYLESIERSFDRQVKDLAEYRNKVVPAQLRTDNAVQDVSNNPIAIKKLITDIGIENSQFNIDPDKFRFFPKYPFAFVIHYKDEVGGLWRHLGYKEKPPLLIQGLQIERINRSPLLTNKIIFIFDEAFTHEGWNYSDRLALKEKTTKHELRHLLDIIYCNYPEPKTPVELLEHKTLLELSAAITEGEYDAPYVMRHLENRNIYPHSKNTKQFISDWKNKIEKIVDDLRILRYHSKNSDSIWQDNNYLALYVSSSKSINDLQSILKKYMQDE